MVLQQKQLEKANFIVKITGPVMVQLASSNKWKVPLVSTATTPFAHFLCMIGITVKCQCLLFN